MGLNEDVFLALNGAGNPLLDPVMIAFAVIGLFPFAFLWAIPLWVRGRRADSIDFVILLAVTEVTILLLKLAFAVPRPEGLGTVLAAPFDDRSDSSFPSGHTTRAFVAATFLVIRLRNRRWAGPLFAYAFVMGLSRIYVGAHWPSDVLAGAFIGIAMAVAVDRLARHEAYRKIRDAALRLLGRSTEPRA